MISTNLRRWWYQRKHPAQKKPEAPEDVQPKQYLQRLDFGKPQVSAFLADRTKATKQRVPKQTAQAGGVLIRASADQEVLFADELGSTGLHVLGGQTPQGYAGTISDEYRPELAKLTWRMDRYNEMRNDPAVATVEALITLPICGAAWYVTPGADAELGKRIERNLLDGMSLPFSDVMRQALVAVLTGCSIHEIVGEQFSDGYWGLRKLAQRRVQDVYQWLFDSTGGLKGYVELGWRFDNLSFQPIPISVDRLAVWTWRKENGNPEGRGALRAAYKPYSIKAQLEEYAGIRIERQALGIWIATPPLGLEPSTAQVTNIQDAIERLRVGESYGMIEPDGWVIRREDLGAADVPFETFIEMQRANILQTVLGQFVGYNQGGSGGSYGGSKDASSMFLLSLKAAADWFTDGFNRYVMSKIVRANTNDPEVLANPPKLAHGPVGARDLSEIGDFMVRLYDRRFAIPENAERTLAMMAGLPYDGPTERLTVDDMRKSAVGAAGGAGVSAPGVGKLPSGPGTSGSANRGSSVVPLNQKGRPKN